MVVVSDARENTIVQGIVPVSEHLFDPFTVSFVGTAKEAFLLVLFAMSFTVTKTF